MLRANEAGANSFAATASSAGAGEEGQAEPVLAGRPATKPADPETKALLSDEDFEKLMAEGPEGANPHLQKTEKEEQDAFLKMLDDAGKREAKM